MNFFCVLNFYFFWNHTFVTIAYRWNNRSYHPGRNIHDCWLFLVNENNCYRKVTRLSIVFVLFSFCFLLYISWATIMLQKWKTASLFKATSKKINYNRAMSIGIKTCENNFILNFYHCALVVEIWSWYKIKQSNMLSIMTFSSFVSVIKVIIISLLLNINGWFLSINIWHCRWNYKKVFKLVQISRLHN